MTPSMLTILLLTFGVPIIILPNLVENCFNTPKLLLLLLGVSVLTLIKYDQLKHLSKPAILLILFNCMNLIYTQNPFYTKVAVVLNISCLLFYWFVSRENNIEAILYAVIASGLVVSAFTWFQYFDYYLLMPWIQPGEMTMGTIGNSNYLGAYLIFPLYASIWLLYTKSFKVVSTILIVFIMIAFVMARARASWLGVGLSLPLFFYLSGFDIKKIILSSLIIIFGGLMLLNLNPALKDTTSLEFRLKGYFPPAVELIKRSPIYGTGLWSYRNQVYEAQARINIYDKEFFKGPSEFKPRRVHCEYLETLVDGGILGALLCLYFIISIFKKVPFYFRRIKEIDRRMQMTCILCAIVAIFGCALLFFPFRIVPTLFMTSLFLGMMDNLCSQS